MVFQKGHPRPPLKQKACLVCGRSFQPASGAQMTCSDKCKVEARSKGLNKRGPRMQSKDHEGETREERMTRIDRENPIPSMRGQRVQEGPSLPSGRAFPPARHDIPKRMLPGPAVGNESLASNGANSLELDLSPLESFIRQEIKMALGEVPKRSDQGVSAAANEEIMREIIREIVREEISERLRNLI